jgi:hypothetical protein
MQDADGSVALPKFAAQSNSDMGPALQAPGMAVAIHCPETGGAGPLADFSARAMRFKEAVRAESCACAA